MRAASLANYIAVGFHGQNVVAVIFVFTNQYVSPVTKEPICKAHELYIVHVNAFVYAYT